MPNYSVYNKDADCLENKIYGDNNDNSVALSCDVNGALNTTLINKSGEEQFLPYTAFNELRVANLTAYAGWTFNYTVNNTDLVTTATTGSGTVTQSNSKCVLSTTATGSSSAQVESIEVLRYEPGMGGLLRIAAIFTTGVAGSTQLVGIGDTADEFFFGYNGTAFGVLRRQNSVDTWTPQTSWNGDKFDGTGNSGITLDTTKGNVFSIRFQWLGFGAIEYYIENPDTGVETMVHRIKYGNTYTNPSIYNPTLPILARVENTTNNTNIVVQTSSAMAFLEGLSNQAISSRNSIYHSVEDKIVSGEPLLTIRNKSSFYARNNRVRIKVDYVSTAAEGTNPVNFIIYSNGTLTGASYTDISTATSVVEYDVAATTITGGKKILCFAVSKSDSAKLLLDSLNITVNPGDTLTIAAICSTNTDVCVSFAWREMF